MMNLAELALLLGLFNALFVMLKPVARIHSKIEVLESQQDALCDRVDNLEERVYD